MAALIENQTNREIVLTNPKPFRKKNNLYFPKPVSRFQNTDLLLEDAIRDFEKVEKKPIPSKYDEDAEMAEENPEEKLKESLNRYSGLTVVDLLRVIVERKDREKKLAADILAKEPPISKVVQEKDKIKTQVLHLGKVLEFEFKKPVEL